MPHCAGLNAWKRGETGGPCRVMPSRGRVNGYTMRRDRWALCLLTARSHDTELPSVALDVGSPRRRRFRGRLGMDFRQHPGDLEAGRIKTAGCQPLPDLFEREARRSLIPPASGEGGVRKQKPWYQTGARVELVLGRTDSPLALFFVVAISRACEKP